MRLACITWALSFAAAAAYADIVVPGANGSDGVFAPAANMQIDLALAPTGTWDGPNGQPGLGVYDPDKWAVVFRYSSVNVPAGVTVTFSNHPSGAPVVWLVSGDATIAGTVSLNGEGSAGPRPTRPGPGGTWGGKAGYPSLDRGCGAGPGGSRHSSVCGQGAGGSHSTFGANATSASTYGNTSIIPLIGGSGGTSASSARSNDGGGGGGGALLLAAQGQVAVSGTVRANGGAGNATGGCEGQNGGGSGGAIRIACDHFVQPASGNLTCNGSGVHSGGAGRIRLEAETSSVLGIIAPEPSAAAVGGAATLWPNSSAARIRVVGVDEIEVPLDPAPRDEFSSDVHLDRTGTSVIEIEAENVPTNWVMTVYITPVAGNRTIATATLVSGGLASSIWHATVTLPIGKSSIQARAAAP